MNSTITLNDISAFHINEINGIYNETKMSMFISESDHFLNIINQRNLGLLNESVVQESLSEKVKFIGRKIKEFFKMIGRAIKKFFGMIIDKILSIFGKTRVSEDGGKIISPTEKETGKDVESIGSDINKNISKPEWDKPKMDEPKWDKPKMDEPKQNGPKTEKIFYLEKRKDLFQIITEKFNRASLWIEKNYKGGEKKFGEIDEWIHINFRNTADFRQICNKLINRLDIEEDYEQYIKDDPSLKSPTSKLAIINWAASDAQTYNNRWDKDRDLTKDIYWAFGFGSKYDGSKSFEDKMKEELGINEVIDVTNKNLISCKGDILSQIIDKNKYIKKIKKDYNDCAEFLNGTEQRITNFNNKYGEYGTIAQKAIDNMLKFASEAIKYLDITMVIITKAIINRRRRSISIYNNVLSFYESEKRKAEE